MIDATYEGTVERTDGSYVTVVHVYPHDRAELNVILSVIQVVPGFHHGRVQRWYKDYSRREPFYHENDMEQLWAHYRGYRLLIHSDHALGGPIMQALEARFAVRCLSCGMYLGFERAINSHLCRDCATTVRDYQRRAFR